ncbi:circularly permuted type 2 ATP-grasp protein [Reichenbachiella agarivorans]|uniref:Circularly permuted type 2 ATP-grasp protein n=1 Tax=Reichenbachiella agarivorans TaxID=2979464 RepID=A0ABY6CLJ7_9BACT|nr:circularly permuted type 2 ATP-grasp protein [Reichenbachiella agarivorans]UXP30955.1 circularly permuted type 2 ATP-grasp protein [Reichenbachiella agarivorans]
MEEKILQSYRVKEHLLDEVFDHNGTIKKPYKKLYSHFNKYNSEDFRKVNDATKLSFLMQGITFATYAENPKGTERIFPFDLMPRIITSTEWAELEKGLIQRNLAINLFLKDIYNDKKILKDKVVPSELIFSSVNYNKYMVDFEPPGGIYNHISGTDLIKHSDGKFYVLEDNVRCPSGVSYVLSNRDALKKALSLLFKELRVGTVFDYAEALSTCLHSVAPEGVDSATCAVLTPGMYNAAYFEHSFLAQSMGLQLVEGRDLFVDHGFLYMKTIYGKKKLDVLYRRVDDEFLDPLVYRADSMLGVPGLMDVYRQGNVSIINAPGTGASDDKAVYSFIPQIIKYYLDEDPILNNVHTYQCEIPAEMDHVLNNMENLVIKPVDQSGGYGIFIGSGASKAEIEEMKQKIKSDPREYVAQPIMNLSTHSTFIEESNCFEPRHVDLRAFTLLGHDYQYILKGGLTRVALKKDSLIVNSSQGGGSKDTWVADVE